MIQPIEIFCCAAEADQSYLKEIRNQLAPQQGQDVIKLWDESQIPPGEIADKEIQQHLDSARVFLLLISADFLADKYCNRVMKVALEKHRRGKAKAIPVIVRPANWQKVPILKSTQALPRNSQPISSQPDPEGALWGVAREIGAIIEQLGTAPVGSDSKIEYGQYKGVAFSAGDVSGASQGQIASSTRDIPGASSGRPVPATRDLPDSDRIPNDRPRPTSSVTVGIILKLLVTRRWGWAIIGVLILLSGVLWGLSSPTVAYIGPPPPSTELYMSQGQNGDIYIYSMDKSTFFVARHGDFSPSIDPGKINLNTGLVDLLARSDTVTVNDTIGGTTDPQAHVIEQLKLQDGNSTQVITYTANDYSAGSYYESRWWPVAVALIVAGLLIVSAALFVGRRRRTL